MHYPSYLHSSASKISNNEIERLKREQPLLSPLSAESSGCKRLKTGKEEMQGLSPDK